MKKTRFGAMLLCIALIAGILTVSASALNPGVYTGSVVTSYYNPDTGAVDDGGSANAALGEGMCRSATGTTGLVEVDKNGNTWVTIRLLLASNCKSPTFYVRTGYNSYSKVNYEITGEDSGGDSIDYRFKIASGTTKIKATMYVTPMGRDVLWYLYIDGSTLKAGSGDFAVTIDTSAPAPKPVAPAKPAAKPEAKPAAKPDAKPTVDPVEKDDDKDEEKPDETDKLTEDGEMLDGEQDPNADPNAVDPDAEDTEEAGDADEAEDTEDAEAAEEAEESAEEGGLSTGAMVGIAAVVVIIIAAAVILMRKKK